MRAALLVGLLLLADEASKGPKPWERKVQLPVPVPMALPEVQPTNPFFRPLRALPQPKQTPLRKDFPVTVPVSFAVYLERSGECLRARPLTNPLPGVLEPVRQALSETSFTPAKAFGQPAPLWLDVGLDLRGEVKEGRLSQLQVVAPDAAETPQVENLPLPPPDLRDSQLPATALEQLSAWPVPKRFAAKVPSQELRQAIKLLAEVGTDGKVKRVVFLFCPEGLRSWVLASAASWLFSPPQGDAGPVSAWVVLTGTLEVRMGTLRAEGLRVGRTSSYPQRSAGSGAARPAGV